MEQYYILAGVITSSLLILWLTNRKRRKNFSFLEFLFKFAFIFVVIVAIVFIYELFSHTIFK